MKKDEKRKLIQQKKTIPISVEELELAFEGDLDLMLFFVTWLKNALDARAAYKELHPNVTEASAAVLGSRQLKKVNAEILMSAYGLDVHAYFRQLAAGLDAMKKVGQVVGRDKTGAPVYEYFDEPDHMTRKFYHDKLGKLLKLEPDKTTMAAELRDGDKSIRFIITRGEDK